VRNAGCCVVLGLYSRRLGKLFVGHVGDCRAVMGTLETMHLMNNQHHQGTTSNCSFTRKPKVTRGGYAPSGRESRRPRRQSRRLGAVALTRDHNCANAAEAAAVTLRSRDPQAIRPAQTDSWRGHKALDRVAGSLAVTRAIGDGYLKEEQYSLTPYKENLPYITAEPEISIFSLSPDDQYLVLATDGIWEHASNEEVIQLVSSSNGLANKNGLLEINTKKPNLADDIVNFVLDKVAQSQRVGVGTIKNLKQGSARRAVHDDMCVVVVKFLWQTPC